jgi:hypothetical protein
MKDFRKKTREQQPQPLTFQPKPSFKHNKIFLKHLFVMWSSLSYIHAYKRACSQGKLGRNFFGPASKMDYVLTI